MNTGSQEKIWEYWQNIASEDFDGARTRHEYILKLSKNKGLKVLNIGVGNGSLEKIFLKNGYSVSSLDPDKKALERLKTETNGLIDIFPGFIEKVDFGIKKFDIIIMSEVLEHLNEEVFHSLPKKIRMLLSEDGYFIGSVPAEENLSRSISVCPKCSEVFHRVGHLRSFSKLSLKKYLERYFEEVKIRRRYKVNFEDQNLIGKIMVIMKNLFGFLNIKSSKQTFFFVAKKS